MNDRSANRRISEIILERLAEGEKRLLTLTVSVRRTLQHTQHYKGDLQSAMRASLRKLVASNEVTERDGMYSLRHRGGAREATPDVVRGRGD
jgi:hypothetical protein